MEKGNFRRERLNELGFDRLHRPADKAWSVRSRRVRDRWHRFTAGGWDRTFFAVACAVAVVVALIGVVALMTRGGGSDGSTPAVAQSRPTEAKPAGEKPSPTAIRINVPDLPTNLPTETDVPDATPEPDRTDCDDIRGTQYRSYEERLWYEDNCTGSVNAPPNSQPPGSTVNTPAPVPPTNPPAPTATASGLSAGDAITLGVSWMTTSAPKAYTVDGGTCTAVHIGDHWVVSCSAHLSGCQSDACRRDLQVCVYDADRRVVPASNC
jgi:hypothetical protein